MLKKFRKTLYIEPVRIICISLVLYAYSIAGQLIYTSFYPDPIVNPWLKKVVDDPVWILAVFAGIPILYGTCLFIGIIKNKISIMKIGLMISWVYHLGFSALNILFLNGQGAGWIFALFVGTMSLLSYMYYTLVD